MLLLLAALGCHRPPPLPAGGVLAPCWKSPNCVSSQADPADARHHVAPIAWVGPDETVRARLKAAALSIEGVALVDEGPDHLRFTCALPSGLFTDDLDLVIDRAAREIHVRSSSRLGWSDRGVNRARVERIRAAFSR